MVNGFFFQVGEVGMFDCRESGNIYQIADLIDDQIRSKRRSEEASVLIFVVVGLLLGGIILAPFWFLAKRGRKDALVAAIPLFLLVFGIFVFLITNIESSSTAIPNRPAPVVNSAPPVGPVAMKAVQPKANAKPAFQPIFEPLRMKPSFARIKRELPVIPDDLPVSPALRSLLADPDGFYVAQIEYRTLRKDIERLKAQQVPLEDAMYPPDLSRWQQLNGVDYQIADFGCIFEWKPGMNLAELPNQP